MLRSVWLLSGASSLVFSFDEINLSSKCFDFRFLVRLTSAHEASSVALTAFVSLFISKEVKRDSLSQMIWSQKSLGVS